ncbi:uncharacterized protein LOC135388553 [Ornithodoros turicata]|uniref:uncharacterized protein LOC135388553 n=1 Tax=Ornithodoros turicata TaxID=34597 RepID=UPI00313924AE
MLPFVAGALESILRSLLARILKKHALNTAHTLPKLLKVDFDNPDSIISVAAFDMGLSVKTGLRKIPKETQLTMLNFRKLPSPSSRHVKTKLIDRSPLKNNLTRGASCLDPACALPQEVGQKQLTLALEVLTENEWLTSLGAEQAQHSCIKISVTSPTFAASYCEDEERESHCLH